MPIELPPVTDTTSLLPPEAAARTGVPLYLLHDWLEDGLVGRVFDVYSKAPDDHYVVTAGAVQELAKAERKQVEWAARRQEALPEREAQEAMAVKLNQRPPKPSWTHLYPDDDTSRAARRTKVIARWDSAAKRWLVGARPGAMVPVAQILRGTKVDGLHAQWDEMRQGVAVWTDAVGEHERVLLSNSEPS